MMEDFSLIPVRKKPVHVLAQVRGTGLVRESRLLLFQMVYYRVLQRYFLDEDR